MLAAGGGCGGPDASAPTGVVETLAPRARTAHFEVQAGLASDDTVAEIAAGLEARYGRVVADLETGEVARITVEVWKDEASYFASSPCPRSCATRPTRCHTRSACA